MKVIDVRYLTEKEVKDRMFYFSSVVMFLSNGKETVTIVTQRDSEGNDGGAIFGNDKNGKEFTLPVLTV